jgi:hypothetical protein
MSKSNPPLSFPAYVMDKLNDQQIQIDTLKNSGADTSGNTSSSSTSTITGSNLSADTIQAIQNIPTSASAPEDTIGYQKSYGVYTVETDYKYQFVDSTTNPTPIAWTVVEKEAGNNIQRSNDGTSFTLAPGRTYSIQYFFSCPATVFPDGIKADVAIGPGVYISGYTVEGALDITYNNGLQNTIKFPNSLITPYVNGKTVAFTETNATMYGMNNYIDYTVNTYDMNATHLMSIRIIRTPSTTSTSTTNPIPQFVNTVPTFNYCKLFIYEL